MFKKNQRSPHNDTKLKIVAPSLVRIIDLFSSASAASSGGSTAQVCDVWPKQWRRRIRVRVEEWKYILWCRGKLQILLVLYNNEALELISLIILPRFISPASRIFGCITMSENLLSPNFSFRSSGWGNILEADLRAFSRSHAFEWPCRRGLIRTSVCHRVVQQDGKRQ